MRVKRYRKGKLWAGCPGELARIYKKKISNGFGAIQPLCKTVSPSKMLPVHSRLGQILEKQFECG